MYIKAFIKAEPCGHEEWLLTSVTAGAFYPNNIGKVLLEPIHHLGKKNKQQEMSIVAVCSS